MAVTFSSLSTNNKNVHNRLLCWAITTVGIALQERKTSSATQLCRESGIEFSQTIDKCDVALLCQEFLKCDTPLPDDILTIKGLLKGAFASGSGGDKIWRKWTDYKHIFRNYYRPYFVLGSGMNEDDAILLAAKRHWAYKRNKNIKVHNNKCIKEGKPEQQKDTVNHEDAPDNLNQSGELFPEAVVFLMFANHPIFQPDMPSSKSPSDSSSAKNTSTPDNENESEDGEESTLRSRMTSKGLFKSRNTQRAEELKLGNKKSKSNVYSQDVIDLTKEKTEVAKEHVQAAKSQVEMMKFQCKLSAIDHAIKVGINVDRLRPCVEKTLQDLFPDIIPVGSNSTRSTIDDVIDLDATSDCEKNNGTTTVDSSSINKATSCRAGKHCKEPEMPLTNDFKCFVCKGYSHTFCVGDITEHGYLCYLYCCF